MVVFKAFDFISKIARFLDAAVIGCLNTLNPVRECHRETAIFSFLRLGGGLKV